MSSQIIRSVCKQTHKAIKEQTPHNKSQRALVKWGKKEMREWIARPNQTLDSRIPKQSAIVLHLHLSTSIESRKNVDSIFNSIESSESSTHIDQISLENARNRFSYRTQTAFPRMTSHSAFSLFERCTSEHCSVCMYIYALQWTKCFESQRVEWMWAACDKSIYIYYVVISIHHTLYIQMCNVHRWLPCTFRV